MGNERDFEPYDKEMIQKAKKLLTKVYEYYYGAPGWARKVKRLKTILAKITELQNL